MTIELIGSDRDLSWLSQIHRPDTVLSTAIEDYSVAQPFSLPVGSSAQTPDGQTKISLGTPYSIACGGTGIARYYSGNGADVAIRGSLGDIVVPQPLDIVAWAIETFFLIPNLIPGQPMSLDALSRHKELSPPTLTRCPQCRGKMREPGAEARVGEFATRSDGVGCVSAPVCERCGGQGRIADFSDGLETIQGVTVDWRALNPIVPHLRGDVVMVGRARSLHALGGFDLHLWPSTGRDDSQEREWSVLWSAVPADAKLTEAAA